MSQIALVGANGSVAHIGLFDTSRTNTQQKPGSLPAELDLMGVPGRSWSASASATLV
jgi:hypothetical protein